MVRPFSTKAIRLREKLAMQRRMTPRLEREFLALSDEIVFERENWIDAFIDYGHFVNFEGIKTHAFRGLAIRDEKPFWLVRREDKKLGYHAIHDDPIVAVEEARNAWERRKSVRDNWELVEELARDLIAGRRKFRVRIEDAHASPLCSMGIDAFLSRVRMSGFREISGRLAALLMKIEAQVGFVIHEAYLRQMEDAGFSTEKSHRAAVRAQFRI